MKSFAAIIAAVGFVASVHAETAVKSEYFYQTAADKNQGTVAVDYMDSTTKRKNPSTYADYKKSLTPLTLRYERGLTEEWSVGAQLGYLLGGKGDMSGSTAGDSYDIKGMSDLVVYMRGQHGIQSNMSIHYGLDLGYSLGKAKTKATTAGGTTESTYQTGGIGITPYVGVAYAMDSHIFGARLTTGFDLGDRKLDNEDATGTTSSKVSGMHTTKLAAFYETAALSGIVGAELSYSGTSTLKSKTETNPATETRTAQQNMMGIHAYGAWDVNEMATVLGNVGYDWNVSDTEYLGDTKAMSVGVAGRFTF